MSKELSDWLIFLFCALPMGLFMLAGTIAILQMVWQDRGGRR